MHSPIQLIILLCLGLRTDQAAHVHRSFGQGRIVPNALSFVGAVPVDRLWLSEMTKTSHD
jgi:hypothetical protein